MLQILQNQTAAARPHPMAPRAASPTELGDLTALADAHLCEPEPEPSVTTKVMRLFRELSQ